MVRKRRSGNDTNALDDLIVRGNARLRFAEGFEAFADSPEISAIIRSALSSRRIVGENGSFALVRNGEVYASSPFAAAPTSLSAPAPAPPPWQEPPTYSPPQKPDEPLGGNARRVVRAIDRLLVSEYLFIPFSVVEVSNILLTSAPIEIPTVVVGDSLSASDVAEFPVTLSVCDELTAAELCDREVIDIVVRIGDVLSLDGYASVSVSGRRVDVLSSLLLSEYNHTFPRYRRVRPSSTLLASTYSRIGHMEVRSGSALSVGGGTRAFRKPHIVRAFDPGLVSDNARVTSPTVVTIAATTPTAYEGGASGQFTLTRYASDISQALAINYTLSGTATSGSDFTAMPNPVYFAAGSATRTMNVVPIDDATSESDETVIVTLNDGGANYRVGNPGAATVMIVSDDVGNEKVVDGGLEALNQYGSLINWFVDEDGRNAMPNTGGNPGHCLTAVTFSSTYYYQTITLTAGAAYRYSFDALTHVVPGAGDEIKLVVSKVGDVISLTNGIPATIDVWETTTGEFTATLGGLYTLKLLFVNGPNTQYTHGNIDNISIKVIRGEMEWG